MVVIVTVTGGSGENEVSHCVTFTLIVTCIHLKLWPSSSDLKLVSENYLSFMKEPTEKQPQLHFQFTVVI